MPRDCARCECGRGVSLFARLVSGGCFAAGVVERSLACLRDAVCRLRLVVLRVAGLWRFVLFVGYCVVCVS